MTTITATAQRDGKFWVVYVPEVDQYTQGRNLADAQTAACELAATLWGLPAEDVTLESFRVELPADLRSDLDRAARLRREAEMAERESVAVARAAAQRMSNDLGMTLRDIGIALGVSSAVAAELVNPAAALRRRPSVSAGAASSRLGAQLAAADLTITIGTLPDSP